MSVATFWDGGNPIWSGFLGSYREAGGWREEVMQEKALQRVGGFGGPQKKKQQGRGI